MEACEGSIKGIPTPFQSRSEELRVYYRMQILMLTPQRETMNVKDIVVLSIKSLSPRGLNINGKPSSSSCAWYKRYFRLLLASSFFNCETNIAQGVMKSWHNKDNHHNCLTITLREIKMRKEIKWNQLVKRNLYKFLKTFNLYWIKNIHWTFWLLLSWLN